MPPCLATEADAKTAPANNSNNSSSSSSCSSRPPEQQTKRLVGFPPRKTMANASKQQDRIEGFSGKRASSSPFPPSPGSSSLLRTRTRSRSPSNSSSLKRSTAPKTCSSANQLLELQQRMSRSNNSVRTTVLNQVLVHRSGSPAVKEYLQSLKDICKDQEERCSSGYRSLSPPNETMTILAHWSKDAYYAIVISKNGGIPTIINVMRAFLNTSDSDHEDFSPDRAFGNRRNKAHSNASRFQACCARVLFALSNQSEGMKRTIVKEGGVDLILAASRKYPRSIDTEAMASLLEYQLNHKEDEQEKQEHEESTTRTEDSTGFCPSSGASSLAGDNDVQEDNDNANTTTLSATTTTNPPPSSSQGTHEVIAYF